MAKTTTAKAATATASATASQASNADAGTTSQPAHDTPPGAGGNQSDAGALNGDTSSSFGAPVNAGATGADGVSGAASDGAAPGDAPGATPPPPVASGGSPAPDAPVGSDDVQAPAKGNASRSASAPLETPPVSYLLDRLREAGPEEVAHVREMHAKMAEVLALLDLEHAAAAGVATTDTTEVQPQATVRAVVLFAAPGSGRKVGDLVEGTEKQVSRLAGPGDIDRHPDAVAAAEQAGVAVHSLGG